MHPFAFLVLGVLSVSADYLDTVLEVSNDSPLEGLSNVTFTCLSNITNINTYTWYRNITSFAAGQEHEVYATIAGEHGKVYEIIQGNRNQSGLYACAATNGSYTSTSLHTHVQYYYLDGPVVLDTSPTVVKEGDSVTFTCKVSSNDICDSKWYKDGEVKLTAPSNVYIKVVDRSYTGNYTCEVTTLHKHPPIRSSYSKPLEVLWLDIKPTPVNQRLEADVMTSFTVDCAGNLGKPPTTIKWTRNGVIVTNVVSRNNGLMLNFSNVDAKDFGEYTCETSDSAANVQSRNFTFIPLCKLAVGEITLLKKTATTITISWKKPVACTEQDRVPTQDVQNFTIYYKNVASSAPYVTLTVNETTLQHELLELDSDAVYMVKISATNRNGEGVNATKRVNTSVESSPTQPRNLVVQASHRTIDLRWDVPYPTNGKILRYRPCYKMTHFDGEPKIGTEICRITSALNFEFNNLGDFNTYDVTVRAENSAGNGTAATDSGTTGPGIPETVNFTLDNSVDNQITIRWERPEHIYGKLMGYTAVKYRDYRKHPHDHDEIKGCNMSTFRCVVSGLRPNSEHTFGVYVSNHASNSKVEPQSVTTQPALPPVEGITLEKPAESSIRKNAFAIRLPKYNEVNGRIMRYDVIVLPRGENGQQPTINTSAVTNKEINSGDRGFFIAGKLKKYTNSFVIGGGSGKAWGSPKRIELKKDTYYAVFLRLYVKEDLYTSTDWYPVVKTLKTLSGGQIAGVVIGVLLVICLVVGILVWRRRRRLYNGDIRWKSQEGEE